MTTGNILCVGGASGHLATALPETEDAMRRTVAAYQAVRPYMIGDFRPLLPHDAAETAWYAYQFHRPDLAAGIVVAFRRAECVEPSVRLRLGGLERAERYAIRFRDGGASLEASGGELLDEGLPVTVSEKPGAAIAEYEAVAAARR